MRSKERGEVGEGFVPDAKRGKVAIVCEMYGGGEEICEKRVLSLGRFFCFFFFFCNHALFVSGYKKPYAA